MLKRLAPQNEHTLLEKGFVTYIWIQTSSPNAAGGLEPLGLLLTKLNDDWKTRLTPEATQASLIVGGNPLTFYGKLLMI